MTTDPREGRLVSNAETRAANLTTSKASEIPATKQFAVNATGNLFVATTLNGSGQGGSSISGEAEEAFGQVSVFFAAMTKAMSEAGVALYNYDAIDKLVASSGLFVKVTETSVDFESAQRGITLGSQLVQTLLGLSGNLASIGKSLLDMIMGMGRESVKIASDTSSQSKKVGTIIFVCEYLLGAVSITPVVISIDAETVKGIWEAGPCLKIEHSEIKMRIHKSVYLFVPPSFVKHAAGINEAMSDPEFNNLVESMRSDILAAAPGPENGPKPGPEAKKG